jgi:hypothetical protein
MPKTLIIGNEEFEFPLENENGNYGESVTSWAEAVSTALETVQAPNDIPITTAAILNNVSSPTSILGFNFDTSEVIAITGEYIVRRSTEVPANNLVENGTIQGNFDGSNWTITHRATGDAGITFDITPSGQITYISTNVTGSNYSGEILFKAKVFNQPE